MALTDGERLAALEAKVQDMLDRQAIFECIKRSSRGNDRFDEELVASSFHPDAIHDNGRRQVEAQGYGVHANAAHGKLFDANLHNVMMNFCEIYGDVAHAESYSLGLFLDAGADTGRVMAGRYFDRLEKRDGEWRIVLRRTTVEVCIEGKARLPLGEVLPGSGYFKGDRDRTDLSYHRPLTLEGGSKW